MARVKKGRYRGLPKNDVLIAKAMANAQYAPKLSALQSMVQQAGEDYLTDVAAAKGTARAVIKGAKRARKPTAQVFNAATEAAQTAASDVQAAFGKLGAGADPFEAVTAREQGAALTRIAEAKANALNELKQRKQEARGGRALGLAQAQGTLRSDVRKLNQQQADIRYQKGNYIAGQLGTAAKDRAERRADAREAAKNRANQKTIADTYANQKGKGGKGSGDGSDGATNIQLKDLRDQISEAIAQANKLKSGNYKVKKLGKSGKQKTVQGDPLIRGAAHDRLITSLGLDDSAARIALDIVYDRGLSKRNVRMLRNLGYDPKRLEIGQYLPGNVRAKRKRTQKKGWEAQQGYYEGTG